MDGSVLAEPVKTGSMSDPEQDGERSESAQKQTNADRPDERRQHQWSQHQSAQNSPAGKFESDAEKCQRQRDAQTKKRHDTRDGDRVEHSANQLGIGEDQSHIFESKMSIPRFKSAGQNAGDRPKKEQREESVQAQGNEPVAGAGSESHLHHPPAASSATR
jgi:hypothetical protein